MGKKKRIEKVVANTREQHNAHTTSAPVPFPASTSPTIARVRGRRWKINLSLARGLQSVGPRGDGRWVSLGRRLSWLGRACFEGFFGMRELYGGLQGEEWNMREVVKGYSITICFSIFLSSHRRAS